MNGYSSLVEQSDRSSGNWLSLREIPTHVIVLIVAFQRQRDFSKCGKFAKIPTIDIFMVPFLT